MNATMLSADIQPIAMVVGLEALAAYHGFAEEVMCAH